MRRLYLFFVTLLASLNHVACQAETPSFDSLNNLLDDFPLNIKQYLPKVEGKHKHERRFTGHPPTPAPPHTGGGQQQVTPEQVALQLAKERLVTKCTGENVLAMTFSNGVHQEFTPIIVKHLEDNGIKGTFFLKGGDWSPLDSEQSQKIVVQMMEYGHQVASHGYLHVHLHEWTDKLIKSNMIALERKFMKFLKKYPIFMRPPHVELRKRVYDILKELGYIIVMVDSNTFDWSTNQGEWKADIEKTKKSTADEIEVWLEQKNNLPLMHDVYEYTANILVPAMIKAAKERKVTFVTAGECAGMPNPESWYSTQTRNFEVDEDWIQNRHQQNLAPT